MPIQLSPTAIVDTGKTINWSLAKPYDFSIHFLSEHARMMTPCHYQLIADDATVKNYAPAKPLELTSKFCRTHSPELCYLLVIVVPIPMETRLIEVSFTAEGKKIYPYCTKHAGPKNPYGLGMIPDSTCEENAKLFLYLDKYILQYQVLFLITKLLDRPYILFTFL